MLMKKITFNAPLNHKAYSYEPMQIEVEKIIPLYGKRFEQMRDHPLAIFIFGNKINSGEVVLADGCKKEFEIAVNKGKIIIPVGSTGYMAKELLLIVKNNIDKYLYLKDYILALEEETDINKLIDLI